MQGTGGGATSRENVELVGEVAHVVGEERALAGETLNLCCSLRCAKLSELLDAAAATRDFLDQILLHSAQRLDALILRSSCVAHGMIRWDGRGGGGGEGLFDDVATVRDDTAPHAPSLSAQLGHFFLQVAGGA